MAEIHVPFTTLDEQVIARLARSSSETGVLSIYEPIVYERPDAWLIHARSRLARIASDTPYPERRLVKQARDRALEVLNSISERATPFRSLAAFLDLDDPANDLWIGMDLSVNASVTLSHYPQVSQLLSLSQLAAPTGIVRIAHDAAAIDEWRAGTITPVDEHRVVIDTGEWRRKQGPASTSSGRSYRTTLHKDRFVRMLEQHRHDALTTWLSTTLNRDLRKRGWRRLVLFGPDALKRHIRQQFHDAQLTIIDGGQRDLVNTHRDSLTKITRTLLDEYIETTEDALVNSILSGQATNAIVGVDHTKQALMYQNAATLVIGTDGETAGNGNADESERIMRQVLTTGGDVIVLHGNPARSLTSAGGMAALLRL